MSPLPSIKRVLTSLPCRCAYALSAGVAVVALIATGLVTISGAEAPVTQTAYTSFRFPDDEKTLKEFSARLERETQDLNDISPAAGGDSDETATTADKREDDVGGTPQDDIGPKMPEVMNITRDKTP